MVMFVPNLCYSSYLLEEVIYQPLYQYIKCSNVNR